MSPALLAAPRFSFRGSPAACVRQADSQRALRPCRAAGKPRRRARASVRPPPRRRSRRAALHRSLDARQTIRNRILKRIHNRIRNPQSAIRNAHPGRPLLRAHRGALEPSADRRVDAAHRRTGGGSHQPSPPRSRRPRRAVPARPHRVLGKRRPDQLRADEHRRLGGHSASGGSRSRSSSGRRVAGPHLGSGRRYAGRGGRRWREPAGSSRATSWRTRCSPFA